MTSARLVPTTSFIIGANWNGPSMGGVGETVSNIQSITCVADLIFYDGFD